jgi:cytochrome P450
MEQRSGSADGACPFPLHGSAFKRDPYPTYSRMRDEGAVHQVEFPSGVVGWLVVGYEAARATLTDHRLGKDHLLGNDAWRELAAVMPEPQHSHLQVHLLHRDPPKHTAMRRLVLNGLAPRRIEAHRPRVEQIAHELIDEIAGTGEADLVPTFTSRFPFLVLSEVIGLPPRLRDVFNPEWCKVVQPVGPRSPRRAHYIGLLEGLQGYIDEVIAHKRTVPEDDLLGSLVRAEAAGEITGAELSSSIFQLLVAGQEPVSNQLTTALVALLSAPDQLARLRDDPTIRDSAVEELMRFDAAFELTTWRFFRETTELYGVKIPAGDSVIVSLASANRDPRQFPDPDRLDLTRDSGAHLTFGHGIHFCAGAALGRMEMRIALEVIVERLSDLRLAVPADELPWIQAVLGRGTQSLPVTFTPERSNGSEE